MCLAMEVCSGGELFDAIVKKGHYTEKDAASLIRTIVGVVAHCHNMGVIHRDLKPENFLLSDRSAAAALKATDFGLSSFFQVRGGAPGASGDQWGSGFGRQRQDACLQPWRANVGLVAKAFVTDNQQLDQRHAFPTQIWRTEQRS